MRQALSLHPDVRCGAVAGIEVDASRGPGLLVLRFALSGVTERLVVPAPAAAARADGLWRHTCLEAFVRPLPDDAYWEINLAPSGEWAAYRFDGYRQGMSPADIPAPRVDLRSSPAGLELAATIDLGSAGLAPDRPWRLGLSAVVEEAGAANSYWALAHPPGRPDFHHADCFAMELPAPVAA